MIDELELDIARFERVAYAHWLLERQSDRRIVPNPFDRLSATDRRRVLRRAGHWAYELYLRSDAWRTFRRRIVNAYPFCERCGVHESDSLVLVLDVHHTHYRTLGDEQDADVMVLCRPCHQFEDSKRRRRR